MRTRPLLLVAALAVAGCDRSPSGPPDGVPARLTLTQYRPTLAGLLPAPTIAAVGDSIVADAVIGTTGCYDYSASAGRSTTGRMVVTILARENGQICLTVLWTSQAHVVVHPAPQGTYEVALRERGTGIDGAQRWDRDVARATVVVPSPAP